MRTHGTRSLGIPVWLAVLTLGLPLLLAGCEGGGTQPAADDPQTGNSQSGSDGDRSASPNPTGDSPDNTRKEDKAPTVYEWGLPSSDPSVGEEHHNAEDDAYEALEVGCSKGDEFLKSKSPPEYEFESPRNVLLFAAGIQLCKGDRVAAAKLFAPARALGSGGLAPEAWSFCKLYKTVRSVLEQRAPEAFRCAGGDPPPYKVHDNRTDDPLTLDRDESVAPGSHTDNAPEPDTGPNGENNSGTPSPETSTEPAP